jgi:hypothetical protein
MYKQTVFMRLALAKYGVEGRGAVGGWARNVPWLISKMTSFQVEEVINHMALQRKI